MNTGNTTITSFYRRAKVNDVVDEIIDECNKVFDAEGIDMKLKLVTLPNGGLVYYKVVMEKSDD